MIRFSLEAEIIEPKNNEEIKKAIILLHGYGGDGKDISMLSYNWKRHLSNTIIICPNGHEKCSLNPNGYQWFDLSSNDENFILNESLKAEIKLNYFLEEIKNKFNLKNNDICISGFSQGCMMSLNIGLTSSEEYNSIIGFSGKIINKADLSKRIKSKSNVLIIHGEYDTVVQPHFLLDTKDFLIRNKINVEAKIIKNCEHSIPIEASSIALNFIKKNLYKDLNKN
tara:strand:+ start:97 stop:771 length:675 start_codon:yes stop_codon:yes gene_type:complete